MVDVPASTSTTSSITVGGTVSGVLEVPGDHDWYAITLVAGQSITINLTGSGTQPVPDTYLNLRDSFGNILAHNDDSGGSLNSKIVFTATTSGTYYIDAGAWDTMSQPVPNSTNQYTGGYTLSVQPYTPPPVATYDQIANELVSGYWNAQGGETGHHFNVTQGGTITVNYSTLTVAEQNLARTALAEWSDIIGVTFTPVTTGGQIVFDHSEDTSPNAGPVAQTEWLNTYAHVQISSSWVTRYGTGLNSYSFQTYIHEIGHALGLGHAGNYNGTADYAADALFANDAWSTSIMSYFSPQDNSYFAAQGFSDDFALTPMNADIVAMQSLYGLSTTTRTGDTTYGFNSNAGRDVYDANIMHDVAYTIFDSGGNDTLDYSNTTATQTINLNPETFSSVLGNIGNVMIARGTIIENAIGGSGIDTITGNDANNRLIGNAGNDTLFGGAGDDFLDGGAGVDQMTGGSGGDTFSGTKASLNGDSIMDFGAGDRIVFTDASLSGFTFSLSGNTLTYTGGSLAMNALSGPLVAAAAPSGGVQLTLGAANAPHADVTNDFNGDGRSDILWRNDNGTISDWLGQSTGSFSDNGANALASVPTSWHVAGTGDFNGDGRDDILWRNDNGNMSDWLGLANGSFQDNAANAFINVPISWHVAGVGDFNGDGRDDILWRNDNGNMSDWLGLVNGGFHDNAANASTNVLTTWQVAGVGDFNGDGRDDILWRNSDGRVSEWLGQASGGFIDNAANALTSVPVSWHVAGVGDFNGDGRDDILWRNDDGRTSDWLAQANGGLVDNAANSLTSVPTSWHVATIGDFNGDGRDDILWRNDDGRMSDWLGTSSGGFVDNAANTAITVGAAWHVQPAHDAFF